MKVRSRSSKGAGSRSDAGRPGITTSAASASSAGRAPLVTRVEVARRPRFGEVSDAGAGPPHVPAVGATGVRLDRPAAGRLGVHQTALETLHALEHRQFGSVYRIRVHVLEDSALCGNLCTARCRVDYWRCAAADSSAFKGMSIMIETCVLLRLVAPRRASPLRRA
jgi:hypothetical protein